MVDQISSVVDKKESVAEKAKQMIAAATKKETKKEEKIENSRAFLFTITHRLIIDWYRKKKSLSLDNMMSKEGGYDLKDEETTKENLSSGAEGRYLLEKINELSPSYRDSVYLRYVEDLSPPEIGEILGISANAASVRINRGIEELKEKYEKQ